MLLAICIISQYFKNVSMYITGPIINTCIILVTILCSMSYGMILAIITPITAFMIIGNPVMAAIPLMIPAIAGGNIILSITIGLYKKTSKDNNYILWCGGVLGSIFKTLFMGTIICFWLLPLYLPDKMLPQLNVLQFNFSLAQLITAIIGVVYTRVILKIFLKLK